MQVAAPSFPYLLDQASPQSFSAETDRKRLSVTALKAFKALVEKWGLTTEQASALIAVSTSTWDRLKRTNETTLNQDQLTRISSMVGIYKGLHLLFADSMADRWVNLSNKGALFTGLSPTAAMIEGGIPRMLDIRRHVDALRGGL